MSNWKEFLNLNKDEYKKKHPELKWTEILKIIGKEYSSRLESETLNEGKSDDNNIEDNFNNYVLSKLDEYKLDMKSRILNEFKDYKDKLGEVDIINLYKKCISIHDKNKKSYCDYI